ncbi:MAG TPA: hypothetical protein PKM32_07530, partial [Planctomycetota bacterium]|nr:hypothetical protein [Planctomycetota bacterium]
DLENVYSITSSGLGLLINFIQHPNASLGIRLIHVQSKFKVLFDLLGMGDRLKIFPDKEAALVDWQ